jgi:hypothetical protein
MATAADYSRKIDEYARIRIGVAQRSARVSTLRLVTSLPAAAIVIWMLSRGFTVPLAAISAALVVAFLILVAWQARIEERIAWLDALRLANTRGRARVQRDWPLLPESSPPAGIDLTHHPYAIDLDLFGRASLYQWLGPAATPLGATTLAAWLLTPAGRDELLGRQRAVAELSPAADWREHLAALGIMSGGAGRVEIDALLNWAEGERALGRYAPAVQVAVYALTAATLILIALHAAGIIATAAWLVPILFTTILSFVLAMPVSSAFNRAGAGQRALRRYAALFAHAESAPRDAPRLAGIHGRLAAGGVSASECMRRFNRILGCAELRHSAGIFHFLIHAVTLWDFHVLFALERWRRAAGRHIRVWLQSLGELDALALLATLKDDHPAWCTPVPHDERLISASGLGHPLLPEDRRVDNDVAVGPPGTLLLVTGSNMSGKSTLLRSIGLNVVLAQTGSVACASALRLPSIDLQTSIRVQDSLELGLSYFMAALARLKGVVDAAERERDGRVLVYLLDEILQGTNSAERSIAVRAVARHLIDAGAIGAMTTHDLTLASEPPLNTAAALVHFTETVDADGSMRFDYKLRPGLATSRNAIRLMQMIGIDP